MKISRVGTVRCQMGEGPLWDVEEQALYFADVFGKRLWRYDPARDDFDGLDMPCRISALALGERRGQAIAALESGLHRLDLGSGALEAIADPTADQPAILLNDAKVDARGRFLVGTVDAAGGRGAGLFGVERDHVRRLDGGLGITNGPCWSPDHDLLYLADSAAGLIYVYDYDLASGAIAHRRMFADTLAIGGIPDGATVDSEGRLWTAMCDGAKIICFDRDGTIARSIDFPTGFPSSVMFGGADLDRLFVTSIDAAMLHQVSVASGATHGPDAIGGALFVIDGLGARGLPEHRYREG